MTDISFYHLQKWPLEDALPKLLEKVSSSGMRAVIMAGSAERVEHISARLWTYKPESWLPHGSPADGRPADQPVWITTEDDNPNGSDVLVLTDGTTSLPGCWKCSMEMIRRLFRLPVSTGRSIRLMVTQ